MLSLSDDSSLLLLFQFSKMTFMTQTLSQTCLSQDPRFSPHPSKLYVVGYTQMEAKCGPRGRSLSTCCRQELSRLLWSPPAFCNRLTYAQTTCKLYLNLFPAWILEHWGLEETWVLPERRAGQWCGPGSGAPASHCWRAAGSCKVSASPAAT